MTLALNRAWLVGGPLAAVLFALGTARAVTAQTGTADHCAAAIARHASSAPLAGPIQFRGLREAAVPASKVLLWTKTSTHGTVLIRGVRCADGTQMRFWYGKSEKPPDPVRPSTGEPSYALNAPAGTGTAGYVLWSKAGDWKLTVWRSGRRIGSLVFCVSQIEQDPFPCSV
jgi:hypothetical protein